MADDPTINIVATATILIVLALAVHQDLRQHRISNLLTVSALAIGVVLASLASGLDGFTRALAGAGVGLLCLLPLYLCKGMGAGDVKLMAAAGAFLGPVHAFVAALITLAAGSVLAIIVVSWRAIELRSASVPAGGSHPGFRGALAAASKNRFPYAAAIATGVIAAMWMFGLLRPLTGIVS
jgi:prepilin peptidase CpaA